MAGGITYGASWVELCNRALARLGKDRISSLSVGDEIVNYCNTFLGEAIEMVLSAYSWNAAKKRVQLAQLATAPVSGFSYAYELPVDIINLSEVDVDGGDYRVEGNTLLTDAAEAWIVYIARPSDPTTMPGYLKTAISTRLAALLTTPLTSSESLAQRIAADAERALQEGINADARRSPSEDPDTWHDEER